MALNDTSKNLMLVAEAGVALRMALLNAGSVELSGGSPAYARKPVAWNAPATGAMAMTSAVVFDVPAGGVVANIRLYNVAGDTQYGDFPVTNETFAGQGTYTLSTFTLDLNK